MLYHLHREGANYAIKCKIPVVEGYKPSATPVPYNQLAVEATKALASLVSDANGNNPDLTKHPWVLLSVWKLLVPLGLAVILEWQPVGVGPRTVSLGNVTSVPSSSATTLGSPGATD